MDTVEEIHCDNAVKLFREINKFHFDKKSRWVFRGHEQPNYALVPSIFRNGTFIKNWLKTSDPFPSSLEEMIRNELRILHIYFKEINSNALPVPANWQYVLDPVLVEWEPINIISGPTSYSFKNVLEFMALAQHHGIPTRLLDFTYSPFVALYFACKDVIDNLNSMANTPYFNEGGRITSFKKYDGVIWAINAGEIENDKLCPIDFYVTPYANNLNINKQRGLFAVDKRFEFLWKAHHKDLIDGESKLEDTELNMSVALHKQYGKKVKKLVKKITFPNSIKVKAIDYLESNGLNFCSLMPSYDNVRDYLNRANVYKSFSVSYYNTTRALEKISKGMTQYMNDSSTTN